MKSLGLLVLVFVFLSVAASAAAVGTHEKTITGQELQMLREPERDLVISGTVKRTVPSRKGHGEVVTLEAADGIQVVIYLSPESLAGALVTGNRYKFKGHSAQAGMLLVDVPKSVTPEAGAITHTLRSGCVRNGILWTPDGGSVLAKGVPDGCYDALRVAAVGGRLIASGS